MMAPPLAPAPVRAPACLEMVPSAPVRLLSLWLALVEALLALMAPACSEMVHLLVKVLVGLLAQAKGVVLLADLLVLLAVLLVLLALARLALVLVRRAARDAPCPGLLCATWLAVEGLLLLVVVAMAKGRHRQRPVTLGCQWLRLVPGHASLRPDLSAGPGNPQCTACPSMAPSPG